MEIFPGERHAKSGFGPQQEQPRRRRRQAGTPDEKKRAAPDRVGRAPQARTVARTRHDPEPLASLAPASPAGTRFSLAGSHCRARGSLSPLTCETTCRQTGIRCAAVPLRRVIAAIEKAGSGRGPRSGVRERRTGIGRDVCPVAPRLARTSVRAEIARRVDSDRSRPRRAERGASRPPSGSPVLATSDSHPQDDSWTARARSSLACWQALANVDRTPCKSPREGLATMREAGVGRSTTGGVLRGPNRAGRRDVARRSGGTRRGRVQVSSGGAR